jgi:type IV secretion system protein VirB8
MANKVDSKNFSNYLAEARSWETHKVRLLEKSRKQAWYIAIGAGVLSLLSVFAVAMLTPLKTSVPYVIRVDSATGAVDVVNALTNGKATYDEVMNKYHVQWYVRWREGYSKSLIGEYYKNVGLMSAQQEQSKYSQFISGKNPASPLHIYGDSGTAAINIKSTSFIKDNIALVRYTKEVTNAANPGITHWAATVVFQYAGTPMSEKDRAINPLGFQVLEYRNDPDQEVSGDSVANVLKQFKLPAAPVKPAAPIVPSIQ